jgi:DNA-binding response OmpR family regulator
MYFVSRLGQEISQAEIYRDVWGAEPETMGGAVRVNVSRLRHKLLLGADSCFQLSATAGHGYIFLRVREPEAVN